MANVNPNDVVVEGKDAADTAGVVKSAAMENFTEGKSFFDKVKSSFTPNLAGGMCEKVTYFAALFVCVVLFLIGFGGLVEDAQQLVYEVESKVVPEIKFPAFFMCPDSGAYNSYKVSAVKKDLLDSALKTLNPPIVYTHSNDVNQFPGLEANLKKTFGIPNASHCGVFNPTGSFTSTLKAPRIYQVALTETHVPSAAGSIAFAGFFDPVLKSPFDASGKLITDLFVTGIGNTLNDVKLRVVEVTTIEGWLFKTTTKVTQYKASVSSTKNVQNPGALPPAGGNTWTSAFIFRVQTFTKESITIRQKTFSEVWSALGGLWAASLLLLNSLFKTKVVTLLEGAPKDVTKSVVLGQWQGQKAVDEWTEKEKTALYAANAKATEI
jgi:hypothetical protein